MEPSVPVLLRVYVVNHWMCHHSFPHSSGVSFFISMSLGKVAQLGADHLVHPSCGLEVRMTSAAAWGFGWESFTYGRLCGHPSLVKDGSSHTHSWPAGPLINRGCHRNTHTTSPARAPRASLCCPKKQMRNISLLDDENRLPTLSDRWISVTFTVAPDCWIRIFTETAD